MVDISFLQLVPSLARTSIINWLVTCLTYMRSSSHGLYCLPPPPPPPPGMTATTATTVESRNMAAILQIMQPWFTELLLQPPRVKTLKTLGDRSFVAAAPALWNKLPRAVRHSQNVQTFKKALKTHLFRKAYNL